MPEPEYDMVGTKLLDDATYLEAGRAVNDYSVSLILGNELRGSATLVSIGDIHGLLTADHVWDVLEGRGMDHFCMVLGRSAARFEYLFRDCTPMIVGKFADSHAAQGPDLTFIRLDNLEKLGTIKSCKSFYPLSDEKERLFGQLPSGCPWLLWGAPGELSGPTLLDGKETVMKIGHFVGAGELLQLVEREGFDFAYVRYPSGFNRYPVFYNGVSGGGCWIQYQLAEDPAGANLKPFTQLLLVGVAYYQMQNIGGYRTLVLHGPKSIYRCVVQRVQGATPSRM